MRLTSRLLRLASGVSYSGTAPRNIWQKTKTPGVYVRPDEIEGQVRVFSDELISRSSDTKRTIYWDSKDDLAELSVAEVDLQGRKSVALPGLQIIAEEIEKNRGKTMQVLWEREKAPGIVLSFRPTPPTGSKVLVLKVFLHHSRVAKVTLDKIQKVMHYKSATKGAKLHRIDFNEESLVQCYPFKKGLALRFINCGTGVKTRVSPGLIVGRPWIYQKTMYVHLPESASIMHEQYERKSPGIEGDGTIYGRHQKATAKENERVFKEFMDVLKKVAGEDKVLMLDEKPEKTEEIKRLAKST